MRWSPGLDAVAVQVYRTLFDAQMDHTLERIRDGLRRWNGVHVHIDSGGFSQRTRSREDMLSTLLDRVFPHGIQHDPEIVSLVGEPPPRTLVTLMPHEEVPSRVRVLDGWKYVPPEVTHARMNRLTQVAGARDKLFDEPKGPVVLEGWGGHIATPELARTLHEVSQDTRTVSLYDSEFAQEISFEDFLSRLDHILHQLERRTDMIYFDDQLKWYLYFQLAGPVKVVRLGDA